MRKLTLNDRKRRAGLLFALPFIIGLVLFFFKPAIQSIRYSFSVLDFTPEGLEMTFVGLRNFQQALFVDPTYVRTILTSVMNMVVRVPVIMALSMLLAVILKHDFHGRLFFRAVFFLPVIVVSGIIMEILGNDYLSNQILSGDASSSLFDTVDSYSLLISVGFSRDLVELLVPLAYDIFDLIWSSGVPILLFLAALQTVSEQLYEVARIEGATSWEQFWKITFPSISPMILMNAVYIIADYFTTSTNPVIQMIGQQTSNMRFEYASGLSWMYFIVVGLIMAVAFYLIDRHVIYTVE